MTIEEACLEALKTPDFQPSEGVTHCNQAAAFIARTQGCHDLDNLMADEQYLAISHSNRWTSVNGAEATNMAIKDLLVVGCLPGKAMRESHGHIVVIYPAPRQFSGSLMELVPMCCNIGKTIGVMRISRAFPVEYGEPDYYAWVPSIVG